MSTIKLENGFLNYSIEENEITIDMIKAYQYGQGTGTELIYKIKQIAKELNLPIGLYAEPQDDTISEEGLKSFYIYNGFELDENDSDGKLFIFN
jgi:methyl coenzyme M reductase gamma subunit